MPRIKYLLPLLLLFFPHSAKATWTIDTANPNFTCGSSLNSGANTCASNAGHCAAIGTLIVIEVNYYQSSGVQTASASNANGYTWTTRADTATGANNYRSYFFDTVSTGSSCDNFIITISGTISFGIMRVTQAASSLGSAAFDATCSPTPSCWTFSSNSNPQVGSNISTTASGDLIIATAACAEGFNGWGVGSGYTQIDLSNVNAWFAEYKVAGAAGTENPSFSNATTCSFGTSIGGLIGVAYKEASASQAGRSHSSIISYRHKRNIPWDNRRRKLEIVRI